MLPKVFWFTPLRRRTTRFESRFEWRSIFTPTGSSTDTRPRERLDPVRFRNIVRLDLAGGRTPNYKPGG